MLISNFFKNGKNNHTPKNGEVISLKELSKVYNTGKVKVEALKGVDLTVNKGEMVAITGPSGSGKSTLMNLIGCLDTATSGSYHLRGEAVSGLSREELAGIRNRRVRDGRITGSFFRASICCLKYPRLKMSRCRFFLVPSPAENEGKK